MIGRTNINGGIKMYTVTFDSNGGTEVALQQIVEGYTVKQPDAPTKEGYVLRYWALNGVEYDFDTAVTDNITLVAVWRRAVLPSGYTEIEYLEGTGPQYINTGIKFSAGYTVRFKFADPGVADSPNYFGSMESTNKNRFRFSKHQGMFVASLLNSTDFYSFHSTPLISNTPYEVELCAKVGEQYCVVDGVRIYNDTITSLGTASYTTHIFGINNNGTHNTSAMRLYYMQIQKDDVLIRNYIPALRDSDNVAGLYDTVNNVFYDNDGTGSFTTGPVVL